MDLGRAWTERPINTSRRLWLRVIVAATATMLCTLGLSAVVGQAAKAADAPTVTSVSPARGPVRGGTLVTITGTGFTNATAVHIDTGSLLFMVVSDTEITATTISHADGTADITVVTPDGTSAVTPADQFTFVKGYRITGISPTSGPAGGGNTITITGTGFTGTAGVSFQQSVKGPPAMRFASFTVDSDTQITATVPPAPAGISGNAQISLLNPLGPDPTAPPTLYRYVGPTVTSINFPAFGLVTGRIQVTVKGSGFTSAATVQFGSTLATNVTVLSSTSLTAVDPPGSPGIVDITVTTPDGTSPITSSDRSAYSRCRQLPGFSPQTGRPSAGTPVTYRRDRLPEHLQLPGVTTVDFGTSRRWLHGELRIPRSPRPSRPARRASSTSPVTTPSPERDLGRRPVRLPPHLHHHDHR